MLHGFALKTGRAHIGAAVELGESVVDVNRAVVVLQTEFLLTNRRILVVVVLEHMNQAGAEATEAGRVIHEGIAATNQASTRCRRTAT